jgi:glycosyltransferase involved in cell wall biosynthesis
MPLPTISIVTPSLNQAVYLEETLTSVLTQDCSDLEYIVIDGGSSDGSADIVRQWEGRLSYWVSEPDGGHADAINKGFGHSSGEIMAWINSSDVYLPWTLRTVAAVFCDVPEADWVVGMPARWTAGGAPTGIRRVFRNKYDFLSNPRRRLQQESVFWRRSLWDACGGCLANDLSLACDHELWMRFFERSSLFHVDCVLAAFRPHSDSRGKIHREDYDLQTRATWTKYRHRASPRDLRRAAAVGACNSQAGRTIRDWARYRDLVPWDRMPRIAFDHGTGHWHSV